jgi:hypothetical protein
MTTGCGTASKQTLNLPAKESVDSVTVALMGGFLNESDTEEFKLSSIHYAKLLNCLSPNPILCNNTSGFGEPIMRLKISTRNEDTNIEIPWSGKNKLYSTVDGVACERDGEYVMKNPITGEVTGFAPDESMLLYRFLKECGDESDTRK